MPEVSEVAHLEELAKKVDRGCRRMQRAQSLIKRTYLKLHRDP